MAPKVLRVGHPNSCGQGMWPGSRAGGCCVVGGHAHPRSGLYEPEALAALHQTHVSDGARPSCGGEAWPEDYPAAGIRQPAHGPLRSHCGLAGRPRGE